MPIILEERPCCLSLRCHERLSCRPGLKAGHAGQTLQHTEGSLRPALGSGQVWRQGLPPHRRDTLGHTKCCAGRTQDRVAKGMFVLFLEPQSVQWGERLQTVQACFRGHRQGGLAGRWPLVQQEGSTVSLHHTRFFPAMLSPGHKALP